MTLRQGLFAALLAPLHFCENTDTHSAWLASIPAREVICRPKQRVGGHRSSGRLPRLYPHLMVRVGESARGYPEPVLESARKDADVTTVSTSACRVVLFSPISAFLFEGRTGRPHRSRESGTHADVTCTTDASESSEAVLEGRGPA